MVHHGEKTPIFYVYFFLLFFLKSQFPENPKDQMFCFYRNSVGETAASIGLAWHSSI
jgi:hypothetical protein